MRARHRRKAAVLIAAVVACGAIALVFARRESDRVHVAVWRYQIASHSGFRGTQVCVGLRDPNPDVTTAAADPSLDAVALLRSVGANVVPVSKCADSAVELILGPVTYRSPWEAAVEGATDVGGYRYHVTRSSGIWRVRGADVTWIQ